MARRPSRGRGTGGLSLSRRAKNVKNRTKSFVTGGYEFTSKRQQALKKAQEASARARKKAGNAAVFAQANAASAKTRIKNRTTKAVNRVTKAARDRFNKAGGNTKMLRAKLKVERAAKTVKAAGRSAVAVARNRGNQVANRVSNRTAQVRANYNDANFGGAANMAKRAMSTNAATFARANANSAMTRAKNTVRNSARVQNAIAAGNSAAAKIGSTAAALTGTAQQLYSQTRNAASNKANQLAAQTRQAAEGPVNRLERLGRSLTGNERQYSGRGSGQNSFSFNQGAAANAKTTAPATPSSRGSAVQSKPAASPSTRGRVASKTKFIQREIKAAQKRGATAASARRTAEAKWKNYQTQQRKNNRVTRS